MILEYHKRFPKKIKNGSKIHTIRQDSHNRWKAGRSIQMATGVRTKKYKCFKRAVCISTQRIKIVYAKHHAIFVYVDGRKLMPMEVLRLARNDGFSSLYEFFEWFNSSFVGKIIHWTDKKY